MPLLKIQWITKRISTHNGSDALATTNCAKVPLSRAGLNKPSTPITSDSNAAIHTADTPRRCNKAGSLPTASGNKVIITKNNTRGYNHCTAPCCLTCHSRRQSCIKLIARAAAALAFEVLASELVFTVFTALSVSIIYSLFH